MTTPITSSDIKWGGPQPADAGRKVTLTAASSIAIAPVPHLWDGRLSLGSFGLLGGRESIGKTILADTIAAQITRGTLPGVYFGQARAVIIAAAEDSWSHTIVLRLMAAGADLACILAAVLVGAASAHAVTYWLPNQVIAASALQMIDGTANTRYFISHVIDRYAEETCLAVVLNSDDHDVTHDTLNAVSEIASTRAMRRAGVR